MVDGDLDDSAVDGRGQRTAASQFDDDRPVGHLRRLSGALAYKARICAAALFDDEWVPTPRPVSLLTTWYLPPFFFTFQGMSPPLTLDGRCGSPDDGRRTGVRARRDTRSAIP